MKNINSKIDYTLLDKSATIDKLALVCKNAIKLGVKSVCVYPEHVSFVKEQLANSNVLTCTVISFPSGKDSLEDKYNETKIALKNGADEIDMVLNYNMIKKHWNDSVTRDIHEYLKEDIRQLVGLCHANNSILKVIVESGRLSIPQTEYATYLCMRENADFIKTSTGKVEVGAELNKVKAMHHKISEAWSPLKIKASGGIRTLEDMKKFDWYVNRFGMGYGSVDAINGINGNITTKY